MHRQESPEESNAWHLQIVLVRLGQPCTNSGSRVSKSSVKDHWLECSERERERSVGERSVGERSVWERSVCGARAQCVRARAPVLSLVDSWRATGLS